MKNSIHYCYREVHSEKELEALLHLRYETYRNSKLNGFCPENPHGMDLDAWDTHAVHFGLFQNENGREEPVGYMRIIQQEESPQASWVRQIAWRCSVDWFDMVSAGPKVPFPTMSYFPKAEEILGEAIKKGNDMGEKYCEASRFAFRQGFRSLKLCIGVIESAIAIYFLEKGYNRAIVSCSDLHGKIYSKYGWEEVNGTKREKFLQGGIEVYRELLLLKKENYLSTTRVIPRSQIKKMAEAYSDIGRIYFHPSCPECFYPPTYFRLQRLASQQFLVSVHKALGHGRVAIAS